MIKAKHYSKDGTNEKQQVSRIGKGVFKFVLGKIPAIISPKKIKVHFIFAHLGKNGERRRNAER